MSESEKGKLKTKISQDVIDAAMKSVDKARGEPGDEAEASSELPDDGGVAVEIETSGTSAEGARKELEQTKVQLDVSLQKGRELMDKLKDEHERVLRAVADLENYKKRAAKEKEEVLKFGIEKLLKDFLPVVDNFDRALEHAQKSADFEGFKTGINMTRKMFEDTLAKHGVKSFPSAGKPFDPNFHEAMQAVESADVPPNHVVSEMVRGYTLNDRLVRPALVTVSKSVGAKADAAAAAEAAKEAKE